MLRIRIALLALSAALLAGCAATSSGPSAEARQALAPTGKLRVGLLELPAHAVKDPYTGELKGIAHDIARELAARLGVPLEPIVYPNPGAWIAAGQANQWDLAALGISAERRTSFDFASPYLDIDLGYLVPAASRLASAAEVDRGGMRVAVVARGGPDMHLTSSLRQATLVRTTNFGAAVEQVKAGNADVIAAQKPNLYEFIGRLPGGRILEGRAGVEEQAFAQPKGRNPAGLAYVNDFLRDAKASGLVKQALDRSGLRGAAVAP